MVHLYCRKKYDNGCESVITLEFLRYRGKGIMLLFIYAICESYCELKRASELYFVYAYLIAFITNLLNVCILISGYI